MATLRSMLVVTIAVLAAGCSNAPSSALIDDVTWGHGLPTDSKVIAWTKTGGSGPDPHSFLIFDTSAAGCAEFAEKYSAGATLDEFFTSRAEVRGARSTGTSFDRIPEIPWDLAKISNGRFFQRDHTNGFLSIDLDTHRVYVFR